MNVHSLIKSAPFAASLVGCSVYGGGSGGAAPAPNPDSDKIGGMFEVLGADQVLMNPEVDPDVTVPSSGPKPSLDVSPGDLITVGIPFSAPNGNVVGIGIAFGPSAPVQVVSLQDALGMTSGMGQLQFQVPDSVCDNLSEICHQIQCYEFAVTDIGKVSTANINQIAVACNNCDEPSCQMLLDMCMLPEGSDVCVDWVAKTHECAPESVEYYTVQYCEDQFAYFEAEYGPDCAAAYEAYYACLSQLDCAELDTADCGGAMLEAACDV